MANKKLGTAATELKLPTKKVKGEKKPKWQAKTVNKKRKDAAEMPEVVVETPIQEEPTLPPETTEVPVVATSSEACVMEPATTDEAGTTNEGNTLTEPNATRAISS